jgi:hypothetical protein
VAAVGDEAEGVSREVLFADLGPPGRREREVKGLATRARRLLAGPNDRPRERPERGGVGAIAEGGGDSRRVGDGPVGLGARSLQRVDDAGGLLGFGGVDLVDVEHRGRSQRRRQRQGGLGDARERVAVRGLRGAKADGPVEGIDGRRGVFGGLLEARRRRGLGAREVVELRGFVGRLHGHVRPAVRDEVGVHAAEVVPRFGVVLGLGEAGLDVGDDPCGGDVHGRHEVAVAWQRRSDRREEGRGGDQRASSDRCCHG